MIKVTVYCSRQVEYRVQLELTQEEYQQLMDADEEDMTDAYDGWLQDVVDGSDQCEAHDFESDYEIFVPDRDGERVKEGVCVIDGVT